MLDRRRFLATCSSMGLGATLFPGALYVLAQQSGEITKDMIEQASIIADVPISPEYRDAMLSVLNQRKQGYETIYKLHIENSVSPALDFNPTLPSMILETVKRPLRISAAPVIATNRVPKNIEDLCFATVRELSELMNRRKISSVALTDMYIERLKRLDPRLKCVITLTEDRAKGQASEADNDIGKGHYRGPLHGLPWGAKDLLAVKGYPTTWGASVFEHQMIGEDATVVKRLDKAGAVLVAKLSAGALAGGDTWFGGTTRNPWNSEQGSSGSSAGPASATAAGCVAFSVGTETNGSISAPSTRCGCTGLRPTFGLVPRTGVMTLAWSMDKVGPICRSVEDCALVLDAIYGPDGRDRSVRPVAFNWDAQLDWRKLRIGYLKSEFENGSQPPAGAVTPTNPKLEADLTDEERKVRDAARLRQDIARAGAEYDRRFDQAALAKLASMGVKMTPVDLPKLPWQSMLTGMFAEAAAAFDELTRSGHDKLLTNSNWPTMFCAARFIPAVEYLQVNRARMLGIEAMGKIFDSFDVLVTPTAGIQGLLTNLTGHPALILPNGFRGDDAPVMATEAGGGGYGGPSTPVSLTFIGQLYGEAKLLAFARAYQEANDFHKKHPKLS